jgi:phosphatidylinositol alpha-mannosyltransferase
MKLVSRYFPGSYAIIPNGVDINRFSPHITPIQDYNDDKINILFVGRLEKAGQREGLKYLLRAYRRAKEQFPQSRLIVVAPNKRLRRSYEGAVARWGLRDVVFHDYVPNEDLPPYYKTADIFCAPTTGRESFGIILLEAMAAGKPIVASNIEGYSEVVRDGVEGLLVKPRDNEALASALSHLLRNKPLREKMGAMGRRRAEDYSWESIAQRVMDYYQSLLELPRRQEIAGAG